MRKYRLLLIALFFLVLTKNSNGQETNDDYQTQQCRLVYSLADVPLDQIAKEVNKPWVLLAVSPNQESGNLTNGSYIDANTGKLITPTNARLESSIMGQYKVIHTFGTSSLHNSGIYAWASTPFITSLQDEEEAREEEGFVSNDHQDVNYVVCKVNSNTNSQKPFDQSYIIPCNQLTNFVNAVTFARSHIKTIKNDTYATRIIDDELLDRLMNDKNPYLSIYAFRSSFESGKPDTSTVLSALSQESPSVIAAMVFLAVHYSHSLKFDLTPTIEAAIAASNTSNKLIGFYWGATAGWRETLYPSPNATRNLVLYKELIQRIRDKSYKLGTATPDDQFLHSYLYPTTVSPNSH